MNPQMHKTPYEAVSCGNPDCLHTHVRREEGRGFLPCTECGGRRLIVKPLYEPDEGRLVDIPTKETRT